MDRQKKIIKTSVWGIVVNAILVAFKAVVGFIAGSISIILDAVNNLSDALSSVITIIGTALSGRRPDKKHPYGHGRIEYVTSVLVAVIILIAGVTAMKESIEKIIRPTTAAYKFYTLIVIGVAIVVKFVFGAYVKKVGKSVNSQALVASGTDAFFDAVLSFATLIGVIISMFLHVNLEGYIGAIISVIILKAGVEILVESLNSIIGTRSDKELTDKIKETVNNVTEVHGVYDLTLHNYGPNKIVGSLHIEVDDNMTAKEIHKLTRQISAMLYVEFGIVVTVGIYASADNSAVSQKIKEELKAIIKEYPEILQMHGFYVDEEAKTITFDLVIDFKAEAERIKDEVVNKLTPFVTGYTVLAVLDSDVAD